MYSAMHENEILMNDAINLSKSLLQTYLSLEHYSYQISFILKLFFMKYIEIIVKNWNIAPSNITKVFFSNKYYSSTSFWSIRLWQIIYNMKHITYTVYNIIQKQNFFNNTIYMINVTISSRKSFFFLICIRLATDIKVYEKKLLKGVGQSE